MAGGGDGGSGVGGLGPSAGPPGVPGGATPGGAPGPGIGGMAGPDFGGPTYQVAPGYQPLMSLVNRVNQQPSMFLIDPSIVANDIAMSGVWGAPTVMPHMNPMPMFGDGMSDQNYEQQPFNWGPYLGGFK